SPRPGRPPSGAAGSCTAAWGRGPPPARPPSPTALARACPVLPATSAREALYGSGQAWPAQVLAQQLPEVRPPWVLRLADSTSSSHAIAGTAVSKLRAQGHTLYIIPQCVYEFWAVATRPSANNGLGLSCAECLR